MERRLGGGRTEHTFCKGSCIRVRRSSRPRRPKLCAAGSTASRSAHRPLRPAVAPGLAPARRLDLPDVGERAGRARERRASRVATTLITPSRRSSRPRACTSERRPHRQAVALVDGRRDDQVDRPPLVLEQHEDDPVRGRRALAGDDHPGDLDRRAVRTPLQLRARQRTARSSPSRSSAIGCSPRVIPVERVVGDQPLPRSRLAQRGRRGDGRAAARAASVAAPRCRPPATPSRQSASPPRRPRRRPIESHAPAQASRSSAVAAGPRARGEVGEVARRRRRARARRPAPPSSSSLAAPFT